MTLSPESTISLPNAFLSGAESVHAVSPRVAVVLTLAAELAVTEFIVEADSAAWTFGVFTTRYRNALVVPADQTLWMTWGRKNLSKQGLWGIVWTFLPSRIRRWICIGIVRTFSAWNCKPESQVHSRNGGRRQVSSAQLSLPPVSGFPIVPPFAFCHNSCIRGLRDAKGEIEAKCVWIFTQDFQVTKGLSSWTRLQSKRTMELFLPALQKEL